ncbi:hypothetical protein DVJ78_18050 (plasmid) [Humibacter sp. BT305]|nr:hypothetical protein DVJ78_18050 [Humibacter sp. BT305]
MAKTTTPTVAAPVVSIEQIDPNQVELDPNIRTQVILPPEFVESIRAEGVREPVLARRTPDGTVYVYEGQRRLLAAREAGVTSMLAVFGLEDATGTETGRIQDQLRTFARADLALTDRIAAYEQLALDGISVEKIAKTAGQSTEHVTGALTVAKSKTATQYAGYGTLSLDRLMLIAEFEGDDDAISAVTDCDDDDLEFVAQEQRDEHVIRVRQAELIAQYEAEGLTVVRRYDWSTMTELGRLTDADEDADERPALDPEAHKACLGHVVRVEVYGLDESDVQVTAYCTRKELHHSIYRHHNTAARAAADEPELTPEEAEARAEAEAEAKRQERRTLIANNKAWDTATTVRIDWLKTLLSRKKLPTGAASFVAVTMTRHRWDLSNDNDGIAGDLLGITGYNNREAMAGQVEKTPTRAAYVSLAVALSAREHATSRESWRHPRAEHAAYLRQLETWGYHLSPVERIAAGYQPDPEPTDPEPTSADVDTPAEAVDVESESESAEAVAA